ncbi:hypothetical protein F5Y17DRAFT_401190 [Xylariaceae sp. FL0594]|nr:hypothetical protein F5Y17DRAFT_401190 [Xylariaceae sp. FL0594]
MRLSAATPCGLLACWVAESLAEATGAGAIAIAVRTTNANIELEREMKVHNTAAWVSSSEPLLDDRGLVANSAGGGILSFTFSHFKGVEMKTVVLKSFNPAGTSEKIAHLLSQGANDDQGNIRVNLNWASQEGVDPSAYLAQALYLQVNWQWTGLSQARLHPTTDFTGPSFQSEGTSTSQFFAVYSGPGDNATAVANIKAAIAKTGGSPNAPARPETGSIPDAGAGPSPPASSSGVDASPLPTSTSSVSSRTPLSTTTQPPAGTAGVGSVPNVGHASTGLGTGAIVGIAVGVGGGVLVIATVLVWFFCARRRRRDASSSKANSNINNGTNNKDMLKSYDSSDLGLGMGGVHVPHDKEMPHQVAEASHSRESSFGQHGHDQDPEVYAPYSDRPSTPTPKPPQPLQNEHQQHEYDYEYGLDNQKARMPAHTSPLSVANSRSKSQTESGMKTAAGPAATTTTTTTTTTTSYAHLVEEGMTAEEIRRLEEEERQLDAAIESAGRRGI